MATLIAFSTEEEDGEIEQVVRMYVLARTDQTGEGGEPSSPKPTASADVKNQKSTVTSSLRFNDLTAAERVSNQERDSKTGPPI